MAGTLLLGPYKFQAKLTSPFPDLFAGIRHSMGPAMGHVSVSQILMQALTPNGALLTYSASSLRHVFDPKIHWISLVNSLVIVTFLVISEILSPKQRVICV